MIARPALGTHICLRCQRSLARRKPPSAFQVAFQSTESSNVLPGELGGDKDSASKEKGPMIRKTIGNRIVGKQSAYPLGRLHGRSGQVKREHVEKIKGAVLGEPAKVIVLRDSIFKLYEHDNGQVNAEEAKHIDILQQLEDERGLIGQDEVTENLNSCRPKSGEEPQNWYDINSLVRQLQDGFTIQQLESYIESFHGRQAPETPPADLVPEKKESRILRITPWQPGISEIDGYYDNDPLRGYYMESHTAKQRVILRLLRECWMLELPELKDGLGQFEIEIPKDSLDLLISMPSQIFMMIHLILYSASCVST